MVQTSAALSGRYNDEEAVDKTIGTKLPLSPRPVSVVLLADDFASVANA